jgi:membrane protease YdiL (CAAX protease family)
MEALLLYFVLFFPTFSSGAGSGAPPAGSIPFSITRELAGTLTYTIPALALLWYLISDRRGLSAFFSEKPQKRDALPFVIGLPGLVLIGLGVSLAAALFSGYAGLPLPPRVAAPATIAGWTAAVFSCFGTGYLEESYFRYYLLGRGEFRVPPKPPFPGHWFPAAALGVGFSTFLFAACHIHEGPLGVLNAAAAGVFLSCLFIRYRSLHGVAWAHAAYNIVVYAAGVFAAD